ncbi:hypothetical protein RHMOL_Rhmol08G0027400 [Rhododendron molle]|uniref:Uncharacterized protein n=1 Tax=Rhododendron molle TaxID=49168 RepID=A0ACC0MK75_RHOML|nr:hypothetical protein RHMOL_Rhmol08G0027400 [Rhododendron molle]
MAGVELIPREYGYVILTLVLYCFLNGWMAERVLKARKKYNVQYPTLYASESDNKDAKLFNCIQHPLICASLGLVYIMGRYLYFTGYATGDPKNRSSRWYNVSYPTLYASESENKDAKLFNCVQISFLLLVVCLLWLFAPTDGFGLWCFAFVYGSLIRVSAFVFCLCLWFVNQQVVLENLWFDCFILDDRHFEFLIVCAVKHRLVVPNRSSQNVKWDWARKSSRS